MLIFREHWPKCNDDYDAIKIHTLFLRHVWWPKLSDEWITAQTSITDGLETGIMVGMGVKAMLMCLGLSLTFLSHELEQQALE